jgi:hypothetical protein
VFPTKKNPALVVTMGILQEIFLADHVHASKFLEENQLNVPWTKTSRCIASAQEGMRAEGVNNVHPVMLVTLQGHHVYLRFLVTILLVALHQGQTQLRADVSANQIIKETIVMKSYPLYSNANLTNT